MKLWITKNSEVPVHEQIVAQITLGIASNDLKPGERLPSTRALARRFGVHQNTVSTAYRELTTKGLVSNRKGSGVFVRDLDNERQSRTLTELYTAFVEEARACGHSMDAIHDLVRRSLNASPIARYLVVEPDSALRDIIVAEVGARTGLPTTGISPDDLSVNSIKPGDQLVAMADERNKIECDGIEPNCIFLTPNSVPDALSGRDRPAADELIAVVSGWDQFLVLARLFLLAANVEPDIIFVSSTSEPGWKKSTEQASMIICDFLTSTHFLDDARVRVFPIVAEPSLAQLVD